MSLNDSQKNRLACLAERARHWLEYVAARIVVCIFQTIPLSWCDRASRALGWLASRILQSRTKTVDENLRLVFPNESQERRDEIARQMWHHLFLMLCEIAQSSRKIHDTNWRDYVTIDDKELMTRYFLDWRPTVLVSGHLGNFELALYFTGVLGIPSYAIARPLDNPFLNEWLKQFRESRGQFMFPATGSASQVRQILDGGGLLSLLGDQHAGTRGCWVDFMGRPASCHKAVSLFTLSEGAPMIVTYAIRQGGPLHLRVGCNGTKGIADPANLSPELADVRSLTQWYNQRLEDIVRTWPEQYWWLHRRWKEKPRRITRTLAESRSRKSESRVA